ncbi:MAG: flagellar hook-length control protein FliK [Pseudomonadota bacterium]
MNGSHPIFPLANMGQAVSAQTAQAVEDGNTAFAENLTAALAASSVMPTPPDQQTAGAPKVSLGHGLSEGPVDAALPAANGTTPPAGDGQAPGFPKLAGQADIQGAAGSAMPSDGSLPADSPNAGNLADLFNQPPVNAEVDGVLADGDAGRRSALTATPAEAQIPSAAHNAEQPRVQTVASRPYGDVTSGQTLTIQGDRNAEQALLAADGRQATTASVQGEAGSIDQPLELPINVPGEQSPGGSLKDVVSPQTPLSDKSVAEGNRPTALTLTSTAESREGKVGAASLPASSIASQVIPQPAAAETEQAANPAHALETSPAANARHDGAVPLTHGRENVSLVVRSPAGKQKGEAANTALGPFASAAERSGASDERPAAGKQGSSSLTINEAAAKPGSNVTPGAIVQAPALDAGLRSNIDLAVTDRFQTVLPTEAGSLETARFEPSSNLAQLRAQTQTPHAPAGAQIALQIVRSLPEGIERFSLHLQPAELGSVEIQLNFESGGRLSALIAAERPETLELLQRDSRILERSLGESGLKLANDGLSFSLKQDQQQHQHGQNFQDQAHARETAFRAGRAYDSAADVEPAPPTQRIDGLRLLDIST